MTYRSDLILPFNTPSFIPARSKKLAGAHFPRVRRPKPQVARMHVISASVAETCHSCCWYYLSAPL